MEDGRTTMTTTDGHWVASWATPLAQAHGDPFLPPTHFGSAAELAAAPPTHTPLACAHPGARWGGEGG